MKRIAICILLLILSSGVVSAGKYHYDIPVTHFITDYDANNIEYSLRSDGDGEYTHEVDGIISLIFGNVGDLPSSDRRLETGSIRQLAVTFSQENSVKPGDPGYVIAANPPIWGTLYVGGKLMNKCSAVGNSFYAMKSGDKMICPMHFMSQILPSGESYRLDMGAPDEPETQMVQVSCNAADTDGCTDWFIYPIPVANPDGTTSPGKTRTRLVYFPAQTKRKTPPYEPNRGAFYMTFQIHVTRP